jgi:hypothetical protein
MKNDISEHQSYLLRLWPAQVHGQTVWRAELVHIPSMQGRLFVDLEQLLAYLRIQTRQAGADPSRPN